MHQLIFLLSHDGVAVSLGAHHSESQLSSVWIDRRKNVNPRCVKNGGDVSVEAIVCQQVVDEMDKNLATTYLKYNQLSTAMLSCL